MHHDMAAAAVDVAGSTEEEETLVEEVSIEIKEEKEEEAGREKPSPYELTNFHRHFERQCKILVSAMKQAGDLVIEDVAAAGRAVEEWVFTPKDRPKNAPGETFVETDPKFNFFPPFLTPECIATHHPFFTTMPIPLSCKANCLGTDEFCNWRCRFTLPEECPSDFDAWDDGIGSAETISDLKENQKFALLRDDNGRARWFKAKAEGMRFWCYPILSIPPSIGKLILETLVDCAERGSEDKVPAAKKIAVQISSVGVTNKILKSIFSRKWFIKSCQESLHYCFSHGFVKLVKMLTETDLSNYVTYHGLTYRNRLNNAGLHLAIDDADDKFDYLADTIYLYLILTWQTAMNVWQQAIDENYIEAVRQALIGDAAEPLLRGDYEETCRVVTEIVTGGDALESALKNSLPEFMNQSQITNFRTFVCSKSGVPQSICPILPTDCVPLSYERAPPVLWSHVYVIKLAAYLCNHGNYMKPLPDNPVITTCLCECNLCSPHKMPCYNTHLEDEILALDKMTLSNGNKTATVGVEEFCNCLIRLNLTDDFNHEAVVFYKDFPDEFGPTKPNVFKNKKLLSILKELKAKKEAELLKRGQGIYLNPSTGDPLTRPSVVDDDGRAGKFAGALGGGWSGRPGTQTLSPDEEGRQKQDGRERVQRLQPGQGIPK